MNLIDEGPGDVGSKHIGDCCYIIKKIDVNVVAPTDGANHTRLDGGDDRTGVRMRLSAIRCGQDGNEPTEERFADYTTSNLDMVLWTSRYTIEYCLPLQEHNTEGIVFRVNGEEYKTFDMDARLKNCDVAKWSYNDSFQERNATKETRWMNWVLERRERMKKGLELYDDGSPSRLF
jgi:hypothetical protein